MGQNVPTGQWDIHLPYGQGNSVCEGDGFIYVGTSAGMFSVNQEDKSLRRFSTVNGLSDVSVTALGYSKEAGCLIIGYKNGNIDLMKNGRIINLKDIVRSTAVNSKQINEITIKGKRAYLACDFGIAVVDLEKEELPPYVIFKNDLDIEMPVNQVAFADDGTILAGADVGLYYYSPQNGTFQDFGAWTRYPGMFVGTYNAVVNHDGTLYANLSLKQNNGLDNADTMYRYNGSTWQVWDTLTGRTVTSLDAQNGKLTMLIAPDTGNLGPGIMWVKNADGSNLVYLEDDFANGSIRGFTDSQGITWYAHNFVGCMRVYNYSNRDFYFPSGPFTGGSYQMRHNGTHLWVAGGAMTPTFNPSYHIDGVMRLTGKDSWSTFNRFNMPLMADAADFIDLATDPTNPDAAYGLSYGTGVFKIVGDTVTIKYDSSSTGGALSKAPLYNAVLASSLSMDANGALWVTLSYTPRPLAVRRPDGTWKSFSVPGISSTDGLNVVKALDNGDVWISVRGKGIYAIRPDEGYNLITAVKNINTSNGSGLLPSNFVQSIIQDQDGEVWVGTENGFIIFYNAETVFGNAGFNGVQPVIKASDGNNEKLLDGVSVRNIFVDGGNRKWMATYGAGAYLMSADGYTILQHFLRANSPLLTDNVLSVTVHPTEGNVYFGTEIGIVSYRGDATEATSDFGEEVYAFPNPVRPEFTGPITIRGLANNSELKITDISGQLIYQTTANGGTATWSGNNFAGQRAKTGVYLVFASNEDGSQKEVTRILVMN